MRLRTRQDADGDASNPESLGAMLEPESLGAVLSTGASVSVDVVDVLLPDGEHATNAAPIAKIIRTRFSMKTSWDATDSPPLLGTYRP